MKKNNIKILVLVIVLIVTMVGCTPANKNLDRLSTQTRLRDNNMNNNSMGNDTQLNRKDRANDLGDNVPLNRRDGVNDLGIGNNDLGDRFMNNDRNLSNGMMRDDMTNRATAISERVMALPEIDNASVLINGNTAIVGCDVKESDSNKITNALKQKVEAAVKVADRNIQKVSVTSDPEINTRIQTMTKDMNSNNTTTDGNPATRFTKEIEKILEDITNIR